MPPRVAAVFASYPAGVRAKLLQLRRIILTTASRMDGVGPLEETLKWGQPAYLAKEGSTIRIDRVKEEPGRYAIHFICHTDLVARFRELYPQLDYRGNRSITFGSRDKIPENALRHCISMTLTYRRSPRAA